MKLPESSYISLSNIGNCSKLRLLCIVIRLTGDGVCVCVFVFVMTCFNEGPESENLTKISSRNMKVILKWAKHWKLRKIFPWLPWNYSLDALFSILVTGSFTSLPSLDYNHKKQAHWLMRGLNWKITTKPCFLTKWCSVSISIKFFFSLTQ